VIWRCGSPPEVPHPRDELYFVAAGSGRYRVEDRVSDVGPGDLLFCAAHVAHGFEDMSEDFSVWVLFYGPKIAVSAIDKLSGHVLF